jgi:hypothetical protein
LIEVKDVTDALRHLDEEIQKRVKNALSDSRKLYESRKFKEAAASLDQAMKLQVETGAVLRSHGERRSSPRKISLPTSS